MNAAQWTVLDNLKNRWPYATNLRRDFAEDAYMWCVRNEYIKDGKITPAGEGALLVASCTPLEPMPKEQT